MSKLNLWRIIISSFCCFWPTILEIYLHYFNSLLCSSHSGLNIFRKFQYLVIRSQAETLTLAKKFPGNDPLRIIMILCKLNFIFFIKIQASKKKKFVWLSRSTATIGEFMKTYLINQFSTISYRRKNSKKILTTSKDIIIFNNAAKDIIKYFLTFYFCSYYSFMLRLIL